MPSSRASKRNRVDVISGFVGFLTNLKMIFSRQNAISSFASFHVLECIVKKRFFQNCQWRFHVLSFKWICNKEIEHLSPFMSSLKILTFLKIVKRDQAGCKFTIQIVVSLIDCSQARVCVVVGVHAEAKRFVLPHRSRSPVIAVVAEAVHLFGQTFFLHLRFLVALSLLLTLTFFLQLLASISSDFLFEWWRT